MSEYFQTDNTILSDFSDQNISNYYNQGYVFTRTAKGNMIQTRSLRIDLSKFELNSENRRILNKNEELTIDIQSLPLENYSWEIHAMGKNFYSKKFGDGTMSASKIKEMFLEADKSNMNHVFIYELENKRVGYCLTYINNEIIHYAYPFYDLDIPKEQNLGLGMMTKAIIWAKKNNKKYIYLGSVVEPSSRYKLQFEGEEWFDHQNNEWSSDTQKLKSLLG